MAAAGGDVDAAPLADGAGQVVGGEDGLEGLDGRFLCRLAGVAVGWIERDEVDVRFQAGEQLAEGMGLRGCRFGPR